MIIKTEDPHSTNKEKQFIAGMGSFSNCGYFRRQLLAGYIKAAPKRTDWGLLDKDDVIAYAKHQLSVLAGAEVSVPRDLVESV